MPTLHIDDARERLVSYLREEITTPPPRWPVVTESKYGCDLWLRIVVRNFWHVRDPAFTSDNRQQYRQEVIYRWRREVRAAANGFAQILVAPGDGIALPPPVPAIEIEFAGDARVRIPASVSPALAAAGVAALARG
jgi:hypothetical protein